MANLSYKNLNVHYKDEGNGNTLVFLHGFLEELSMWQEVENQLKSTYRIICIDLLGHGKTENMGYIHTMEDQADMVKYVLDSLHLEQYILVGHSMGGYVSLAYGEMYPETLNGICLMNSTALGDSKEKQINRERGINAIKLNHKIFIRMAIPSLFSENNRSLFKKEIKIITEKALLMGKQGIIASLEGMKIRKDRSHVLKSNDFPILMIIGKEDPALDYHSLLKQSETGNVEKVVFPDGHMSHIENKKELIRTIMVFAKKISCDNFV